MKPTPLMPRLRHAQEFEVEQAKHQMKIVAVETKVKVEQDALDSEAHDSEAHIGAEPFTSQNVNDGEQIRIIPEGERPGPRMNRDCLVLGLDSAVQAKTEQDF